jgi:hypothetical protein
VAVSDASSHPIPTSDDVVPATTDRDAPRDAPGASVGSGVDLDAVERDLAAVEVALERLSEGTYWTDEVTGDPIPEHVLAADPTVRRA